MFIASKPLNTDTKHYPPGHSIPEFSSWAPPTQSRLLRLNMVERIPDSEDPKLGSGEPHPKRVDEESDEDRESREATTLAAQSACQIIKPDLKPGETSPLKDSQAAARAAGVGSFPCDRCAGLFKSKSGLLAHKKTHDEEEG